MDMAVTRKPDSARKPRLPRLYIENFEDSSVWLMLEYRHCIWTWGNPVFTNVADRALFDALSRRGASVRRSPLSHLKGYHPRRTLALDPEAKVPLRTSDFKNHDALVIGGILGNEGFTGKTGRLMTEKLGCGARNLGAIQLSIDSAAVVCKLIFLGMKLEDIELTTELEIQHDDGHSTVLPYGYPVLNGKVILTPGIREYLEKH
jgi:ribosome biogenesis SPOUT family RNA methylase Rps3